MRYILLFLFLCVYGSGYCRLQGQAHLDSMLKELPNAKDDMAKVLLLGEISYSLLTINPIEGIRYANDALALSEELNLEQGKAHSYNHIGMNLERIADYPGALKNYHKSITIFEKLKDDRGAGVILSNIGNIYVVQENYPKALEYHLRSLAINRKLKDEMNLAGDYGNIGNLYMSQGQYDKALEYDMKSLGLFLKQKDNNGIAHNLGNIGNIYKELHDYKKALEYCYRALALFEQISDDAGIALNYGNIGEIHLDIYKANAAAKNSEAGATAKGDQNLRQAITYLNKAVGESRKIKEQENIIEFSKYLSEAYTLAGNVENAFSAYKEYITTRDTIYSIAAKVQLSNLETQRELELKDKEITIDQLKLEQKRLGRAIYIVGIALLLLVIGIIANKFHQQIKANKRLALEKNRHLARIASQAKVLKEISEIQSHDVRGQVATILGLVQLFNAIDATDPINKVVIDGVTEVTEKLDVIVKDMIKKENNVNRGN